AALVALATADSPDVEAAVRGALVSLDPAVRETAVSVAARGRHLGNHELVSRLSDESPGVRAAALRGIALRSGRGESPAGVSWRDGLVYLVDEPAVAAAAGAAVIALGGPERPRLVEEMRGQEPAVRVAALEEIERTGDAEAAKRAAAAIGHEDTETACAAVRALVVADAATAAEALSQSLGDERPQVRSAAAETIALRPAAEGSGSLASAVADAILAEKDRSVLRSLLLAGAAVGDATLVDALTHVLADEAVPAEAESAAEALATRFPEACRAAWTRAPARAERRWARALSSASRRRSRGPRPTP
ncbi:MAG: HEAT repeat domain-containing protein, partial [Thermoanaerobaculia bacterium]|nr:HEAT repeat domain-containing protein [Thermoanaerobaculia bacterium]